MKHAEELDYELSDEDNAMLEQEFQELSERYDGEIKLHDALRANWMSENSYRFYAQLLPLINDRLTERYAAQVTEEDVSAWVEENEQVRAKHILLLTTSTTLDDEQKAALRTELEDMRTELLTLAGDPAALEARFDELMNERSEDTGLKMYPDGYVFTTGRMVQEFEDAAFALEPYGISEVIETAYGYHLLLRLPIDLDTAIEIDSSTYEPIILRDELAAEKLSDAITALSEENEIVYAPGFENFSLTSIFAE